MLRKNSSCYYLVMTLLDLTLPAQQQKSNKTHRTISVYSVSAQQRKQPTKLKQQDMGIVFHHLQPHNCMLTFLYDHTDGGIPIK